jgi:hypothetical protein
MVPGPPSVMTMARFCASPPRPNTAPFDARSCPHARSVPPLPNIAAWCLELKSPATSTPPIGMAVNAGLRGEPSVCRPRVDTPSPMPGEHVAVVEMVIDTAEGAGPGARPAHWGSRP